MMLMMLLILPPPVATATVEEARKELARVVKHITKLVAGHKLA